MPTIPSSYQDVSRSKHIVALPHCETRRISVPCPDRFPVRESPWSMDNTGIIVVWVVVIAVVVVPCCVRATPATVAVCTGTVLYVAFIDRPSKTQNTQAVVRLSLSKIWGRHYTYRCGTSTGAPRRRARFRSVVVLLRVAKPSLSIRVGCCVCRSGRHARSQHRSDAVLPSSRR